MTAAARHPFRTLNRIIAALAAAFIAPAIAAPVYTITNLGDLVGNATIFTSHGSTAYSINRSGQVTGTSSTALPNGNGGPVHVFLWSPDTPNASTGQLLDLTPGSAGIDDEQNVRINDFGQILYTDGSTIPGVQRQPFLWTPATPNGRAGAAVALVGVTSVGVGINNVGQVVGRMFPGFCFAWTPFDRNGTAGSINHHFDPTLQQDFPGYGAGDCLQANGINDRGQAAGSAGAGFFSRPFVHEGGVPPFPNAGQLDFGAIEVADIVGPGPSADPNDQSFNGGAIAINASGHVVGGTTFPGVGVHPFLWNGSALIDVAPASGGGGAAYGLNASDQVVGRMVTATPGGGAFLYDKGTTYQLLTLVESVTKQGWSQLDTAFAINDRGQIVGTGVFNGQGRAFLATPATPACADDVSAEIKVTRGGYLAGAGGTVRQVLTLTNTSAVPIAGPVSIVLDGLSANATLANASGRTACALPLNDPFITIAGPLNPGANTLQLLIFNDPTHAAITYPGTRVLSGSGLR
ncbi:MAG TPA: hypothetical protein VLW55_27790 [Burkholderiaceae bacterium]|nr:hypothetical protein [Burkholderiaceae bacterium]